VTKRAARIVACGLAAIAAFAIVGCGTTATTRLQRQFELSSTDTPEEIESGIRSKLPLGTPAAEILAYLESRGVGRDGLSEVDGPGPKHPSIGVGIKFDTRTWDVVKEQWWIEFHLDGDRKLERIEVSEGFTGL
jgi:hypothetical protein